MNNRVLAVYLVKLVVLHNATIYGWEIEKLGHNKYRLCKDLSSYYDDDLKNFMEDIVILKLVHLKKTP